MIKNIIKSQLRNQNIFNPNANPGFEQPANPNTTPNIIDGEFHEIETDTKND